LKKNEGRFVKFKDLKLGAKQALGFGFILAIMAGANIFSIRKMAAIKTEIDEVTKSHLPRALAIADLKLNTADLRINQLQHAFTADADAQQRQKEVMIQLIDKIEQNIIAYERLRTESEARQLYPEEERRLYAEFDRKWDEYQALSFTFFDLLESGKTGDAVALLNEEAQHVFTGFSADLVLLVGVNKKNSTEAAQRAESTYQSTRKITTVILIVTILVSAFIAIGLVRYITISVQQLAKAACSVTGGNLEVHLQIDSSDEIGNLAHSFNQMAASLREAREQMKKTQIQLIQSEKMVSLGQLTAGIAHEINNPVNFVSSNVNPLRRDLADIFAIVKKYEDEIAAQQLREKFGAVEEFKKRVDFSYLKDEVEDLLDGIQDGAQRTSEIVRGLRNFARLEEGERKRADINQCLESTLLMLKHQFKNRVEVVKDFGEIPLTMCYPGKLNQAFLNILANAGQAIDGPGKIFIKTSHDQAAVTISIKDTGKGMTEEVKQRLFEPFFTTKPVGEGTGLGLPITYGIIQEHGGNIEVYSAPGQGSEFVITLPAART
jgi:signal transduction histidine kinase